jgi:predicted Zn-dependent protease
MHKMKLGLTALLLVVSLHLFAQTVNEAKKHIHARKHNTAKSTLRAALETDPNNPELIYWLAQSYFDHKDPKGAKQVLLKHMGGPLGNNPLLLVAMGQVELTEKNPNDARQRFETAISLTKGKDITIFTAIGKANLEQGGDAAYGIEKLKLATAIKGFKDPMTYIYMGDLYRALQNGGGAVSSYENALLVDPKSALAKHKIGKVYLTQGSEQRDIFLQKFTDAILDDPTFTPALYDMYSFHFSRDVNLAIKFFNEYKKHAEPGPALDYEEASLQFASGNFQNAITKADDLLKSQADSADPRLHRLKAYSYDKLGDSIQAFSNLEIFFQKVKHPEDINPENYLIAAINAAKLNYDLQKVDDYFMKAVKSDSSLENKTDYSKRASEIAGLFKRNGNLANTAAWFEKAIVLKTRPTNIDYYNAGLSYFNIQNFKMSDSLFIMYKTNFPKETVGFLWSFRSRRNIDTAMTEGLAVPAAMELVQVAETLDKVKFKGQIIEASGYLANYFANIKSDYTSSLQWFNKILEVDSANNDALKYKEMLEKRLSSAPVKK